VRRTRGRWDLKLLPNRVSRSDPNVTCSVPFLPGELPLLRAVWSYRIICIRVPGPQNNTHRRGGCPNKQLHTLCTPSLGCAGHSRPIIVHRFDVGLSQPAFRPLITCTHLIKERRPRTFPIHSMITGTGPRLSPTSGRCTCAGVARGSMGLQWSASSALPFALPAITRINVSTGRALLRISLPITYTCAEGVVGGEVGRDC